MLFLIKHLKNHMLLWIVFLNTLYLSAQILVFKNNVLKLELL